MIGFSALILFGLSVMFPCKGDKPVFSPAGNTLIFAHGTNAKIKWSCTCNLLNARLRTWYFKNGGIKKEKEVASIDRNGNIFTDKTILPGVAVEKPGTLILNKVDSRYNGMYKFDVSVSEGGDDTVKVIIVETPTVTINCPGGTTVKKGENFTCVCKGKNGDPPANVTWYDKGEMKIGETGMEEMTLKLTNVDKNTTGKYKCLAFSHRVAQNETSIELIVQFPPESVRVLLSSEIAVRGRRFIVKCEAEAEPSPTFKIFFNETEVPSSEDTYTIPKVNDSHVGFYKCVAQNTLGSNNSTSRYLGVENAETHGNDGDDAGLSTGAIVGIIIGVLVLVLVVAIVCLLKFKKKNHGHERVKNDSPMKTPSGSTSNQPHEYAVLEKPEPVTYAALDKKDLKKGGPEKPARTQTPTEYADIQVA